MKLLRTLATISLCIAMAAGTKVQSQNEDQSVPKPDSEPPLSISLEGNISPLDLFEAKTKKIEIIPGKSLIQEQEERKAAEEKAKIKPRAISPGKSSDPNATIIMADTDYRDQNGRSNCVAFATKYTGIDRHLGYGVTVSADGTEPEVGAIALDRYRGHAAVVVAISGSTLTLWDSNWIKGYVTERKVDVSSQRGYIY